VFNISATELLVIAVVALLVLGPEKLPEAMRKLGRATKEVRRITSGFEAELRDALSDPVETPQPPAATPAPPPAPTPPETPPATSEAPGEASVPLTPANPTAVPEPAAPSTPDVSGEQASSGETAA
jgi:sec-independent protein translocase protein TatB